MTDDLDRLRAALRAAPPASSEARNAALRLAMENFDRLQDSQPAVRPISTSPRRSGIWIGVREMLNSLHSRPILAATTSVAALCIGLFVVLPGLQGPPSPWSHDPQAVSKRGTVSDGRPVTESAPMPDSAAMETAADEAAPAEIAVAQPAAEPPAAPLPEVATALPGRSSAGPMAAGSPSHPLRLEGNGSQGIVFEETDFVVAPQPNTEAFANADTNPIKVTTENPVSTFSIDVDTASYAVVRSSLMAGALPPSDAVRIDEMVNYFPYDYPAPEPGTQPFRPDIAVMPTPWNPSTRLVRIGIQGELPSLADRPSLNLVFLIDTSGSMQDANKLPLLKQGFRMMLAQLRDEDRVAIVTYAGSAGEVLSPTPASDKATILAALDRLEAGGSTGGEEGLQLAYRVAQGMASEGTVGRVLLATDGDFNVGLSDPGALQDFIAGKRKSGVYLSVLGFGRGNLDDATMQALAQAGNGTAAYVDTAQEARKVLVDQLTGALFPIADDVKIQVEWNPETVAEWRLIGYETRALRREDFGNDKVDAGEIGAGTAVTALYEVTAPGSAALRNEPLRYGAPAGAAEAPASEQGATATGGAAELGFLRLRWKAPGEAVSKLVEMPILPGTGASDNETRFAAAIAGFGQLLTASPYIGDWGWEDAIWLASGARGADAFGYRAEAITLMRLAQSLEPK